MSQVAVGDGHAFGRAGRTRGVNEIRDAVRVRCGQCGARLGVRGGIVDIDDHTVEPVKPRPQTLGGDDGDRRGIVEHEPDPSLRQRRINREVRRTGFEHRQHRHDGPARALQQQRHTVTRADTALREHVRQPISGLIEFAIGDRHLAVGQRNRVRGAGHLRDQQLGNRHRDGYRLVQHGAVAHPVEVGTLGGVKQVDRRDPLGWVGGHGLQHPP